jgi:repressor LexA
VVSVPLLGEVAAGQPIFADEHVEDRIAVATEWLGPRGEHFFLKVKGYSMADSILPNDLVLVEKAQVANNGEVVVALLENEATVKRFFRSKGRIELRSDNPEYEHIIPQEDFQILGRVTALMRRY